eukprot:2740344-Rhodomonas_salina.1
MEHSNGRFGAITGTRVRLQDLHTTKSTFQVCLDIAVCKSGGPSHCAISSFCHGRGCLEISGEGFWYNKSGKVD